MKGLLVVPAAAAIGAAIVACSSGDRVNGPSNIIPANIASCGTSAALFSVAPIAPTNIMGWVPLGSLNPPGHTFPTDHQYIYLTTFSSGATPVPVYAPGNVTVTQARLVHYTPSAGPSTPDDYALDFTPCRDVSVSAGLDLSLFDTRVTPLVYANASRWISNSSGFDHFHVAPFSDYFAEPMRSTVRTMLGSFDGHTRRTVEPLGGTIATDVAGTARGVWLNPSQPTSDRRGVVLLQLPDATTLTVEARSGATRTCAGEQPWALTGAAFTYKR